MKFVPLGEIAYPTGERAGNTNTAPVYSVTKHDGFVRSDEYFKKQVFSRDLSNYKLVRQGDFAYSTIHLDEGSIGVAPEDSLVSPMYTSFGTDNETVCSDYLIRFLKSSRALAAYAGLGKGSAERRRSISFARLAELKIPLPPIDEQRRIAAILDKADELRTKRRQTIAHLDALTQSIFNSMFGTMVRNNVLSDAVSNLVGGKNLVGPDDSSNAFRVLKISAVTSGRYLESESKSLPVDYMPAPDHLVRPGDVIISRANTTELVGASALVQTTNRTTVLPDKLWRAVPAPGVEPSYLVAALQTRESRDDISRVATGSGGSMKNISKPKLLSIPIALPSVELQQTFATRVAAVERLKESHRKHLAELDTLFASLQSRAFKGEL